jgi:anion-transporting  ArsA/GET3 family ATPase
MTWDLDQKRIFLVGGPGGVGKTTLAAALALELSSRGYKTLVLTVDPAKRLAQALGFKDFATSLQKVSVPGYPDAQLTASMLDSEHYFDKVIERFAKSPEQKKKILENRLYRTMVESLGGSHEYAAMERLLEFSNSNEYDKIIVDTPPTQNALDLLNAPKRLADFMDTSVLKWFQKKGGFHLFQRGTQIAMKALQTILGSEFLDNLSVFLNDLEGMQAGFRSRHLAVIELFKNPSTSFVLVTQASEARFLESVEFQKALNKESVKLDRLVLNRLELSEDSSISGELCEESRLWLRSVNQYFRELHLVQAKWAEAFQSALKISTVKIYRKLSPLNEIKTLQELGKELTVN